jgi:hypothetical protein
MSCPPSWIIVTVLLVKSRISHVKLLPVKIFRELKVELHEQQIAATCNKIAATYNKIWFQRMLGENVYT